MKILRNLLRYSVTFHAALLPPTVRYTDRVPFLSPIWLSFGYPVVTKIRMGAWG